MRIEIEYPSTGQKPNIEKVEMCCAEIVKFVLHGVFDDPQIDVNPESKLRIIPNSKQVLMNKVFINYCPFCGSHVRFFVYYQFSAEDIE